MKTGGGIRSALSARDQAQARMSVPTGRGQWGCTEEQDYSISVLSARSLHRASGEQTGWGPGARMRVQMKHLGN